MALSTHQMWFAGHERAGRAETIPIVNPATGEAFAFCHAASAEDVEDAIQVAHKTFQSGDWSRADRHHRADVLEKAAALLTQNLDDLIAIEVQQTGRAIREMKAQVPSLVKWFKYYAAIIRTEERAVLPTTGQLHNWVERKPLGVVVQITPFNHPLLIAVKKLAPALAAGNSVIIKPSELTPITTIMLGKILKEAGLPDGVLSVLPGYGATTGKALVSHPLVRKVDVTGGTPAGKAIGALAGGNLASFTAELGGKAPVIVTKHANVDRAANGVCFGSFIASGQTCVASTRIVVEKSLLPQFLDCLREKAQSIERRMGAPTNPASQMGPLISEKQLQVVTTLVSDASARGLEIVTGGRRMTGPSPLDGFPFSSGYYYAPTVITDGTGSKVVDARLWKEEAFGPVIVVVPYEGEEEALRLANDTEFGLGAALWTENLSEAHRISDRIEAGICWVNTHHRNDPSSPWGGINSSGVGSENGIDAYHAYTTTRSIIMNYATAEQSIETENWFKEGDGAVRYG
ncbi:aldehyde dehydrogenase [Hortaea werneckii]|nr:aldehyde dehydrogenase [Hortaea werneckii]KAI7307751.1 aldehyde dehydrogenase [Hortaea werneckii]KAI7383527.1 aldehyde dehydrogenase [Hortaea werneckii]